VYSHRQAEEEGQRIGQGRFKPEGMHIFIQDLLAATSIAVLSMPDALPQSRDQKSCITTSKMRAVLALFQDAREHSTVPYIFVVRHSEVMQATRVGRFSKTDHSFAPSTLSSWACLPTGSWASFVRWRKQLSKGCMLPTCTGAASPSSSLTWPGCAFAPLSFLTPNLFRSEALSPTGINLFFASYQCCIVFTRALKKERK
jgi:hypothetical protein